MFLVLALTAPVTAVLATPAQAGTPAPVGTVLTAVENTFTHRITVGGWAYDPRSAGTSVTVRLVVDGTYKASTVAKGSSTILDADRHISGKHHFTLTVSWPAAAKTVVIKSRGASSSARIVALGARPVTHVYPSAGQRIVTVAKRYLGDRYVDGGATPAGFDCSGYTMYVYAHARVKTLRHNAEQQRRSMRRISRSRARPGDLVFYMSGGSAYHVAIYAGHGWQYAAATPADGVRYQKVWSSAVQYGTDWH